MVLTRGAVGEMHSYKCMRALRATSLFSHTVCLLLPLLSHLRTAPSSSVGCAHTMCKEFMSFDVGHWALRTRRWTLDAGRWVWRSPAEVHQHAPGHVGKMPEVHIASVALDGGMWHSTLPQPTWNEGRARMPLDQLTQCSSSAII